ncbi:hypothetical protein MTP04_02400 [Lysinibacillus sp. PLM2]|nr:hypothetical protein MTP04_02400 [Lysinibacillus sp. PLM2]
MKLGQKVKFTRSLQPTGTTGFLDNLEYIDEEDYEKLIDSWVNVIFKAPRNHKAMKGIICGKRRISTNTDFTIYQNEWGDEKLDVKHNYETIYLVACNLAGFKKVLPQDIEILEGAS